MLAASKGVGARVTACMYCVITEPTGVRVEGVLGI